MSGIVPIIPPPVNMAPIIACVATNCASGLSLWTALFIVAVSVITIGVLSWCVWSLWRMGL